MNLLHLVEYQISYNIIEKIMRNACFIKRIMCGNCLDEQHYNTTVVFVDFLDFANPTAAIQYRRK